VRGASTRTTPARSSARSARHRWRCFAAPEAYTPKHLAEKILTSKAALEGERKQVTILFADLKGSMGLLAGRDPEEARKLLDPVLMMEAVHRYESITTELGRCKPDPEAFRRLAARLGVVTGEILYFDDDASYVEGANESGLSAHVVGETADVLAGLAAAGVVTRTS
jgi:FMN phosphatase YigB (HAD superfamily)